MKHAEQILLEVESGSVFVDLGSIFDLRWKSEVVWDRPDRCKVSGADSDFQVDTLERESLTSLEISLLLLMLLLLMLLLVGAIVVVVAAAAAAADTVIAAGLFRRDSRFFLLPYLALALVCH